MAWLDQLLVAALDNAVGATLLAGIVFLITRWWRNPLVAHALWLLVLVKLVAPPVVPLHWGMSSASLLAWRSETEVVAPEPQLSTVNEPKNAVVAAPASPPAVTEILGEPVQMSVEPATVPVDLPAEPIDVAQSPPGTELLVQPPVVASAMPTDAEPAASAETPVSSKAASPPEIVAVARPWPWQALVAATWLAGSVTYLAIAGLRIARFHRALSLLPAADERVQRLAADVGKKLGYRGRLVVRVSPGHTPPLLWGVGRPTVLLPQQLVAALDEGELAGILAHETAHLVRHDPWVRWFELLVVGLYWWHPVAWYARHALRDAEELACDALVLDRLDSSLGAYARGLLVALDVANVPGGPGLASGLGRKSSLQRRVEAMFARRYAPQLSWSAGFALALVALAFVPLSMRASSAQESAPPTPVAASTAQPASDAQDTLDPRIGPAVDLDPRVRERYRKYLRPPYWKAEELIAIRGKAVDEQGQPVANADLDLRATSSGTIAHTQSDAAGEFELRIPQGYLEQPQFHGLLATSAKGDLRGFTKLPEKPAPFTVTLRASHPIEARVVDAQGNAVPGAALTVVFGDGLTSSAVTNAQGLARVELPKAAPLEMAFARKEGVGMTVVALNEEGQTPAEKVSSLLEFELGGARTIVVRAIDGRDGKPVPDLPATLRMIKGRSRESGGSVTWELPELQTFTDGKGEARFTWASPDQSYLVTVRGWDLGLRAAQDEDHVSIEPGSGDFTSTIEYWPQVKVAGQVRFADGRPAADVPVRMSTGGEVKTDATGRFETEVEANKYYLIVAGDQRGVSPAKALVVGHEPPTPLELVLGPAIRVFGAVADFRRVRLEQSTELAYENLPLDQHLPPRLGEMVGRPTIERTAETDADGNFEFFVGPGYYELLGPRDTQLNSTPRFKLSDQKELRVDLRDSPPEVRLKGKVVRRDDAQQGVADAFIDLDTLIHGPPLRSDAEGNFSVSVPDRDQIIGVHGKGGVGRVMRLQGDNEIIIPIGPPTTLRGRVVDQSGQPLQGEVHYRVVPDRERDSRASVLSMGQAKLDHEGRFALDRIVPGWNYSLWVTPEAADGARPRLTGRRASGQIWLGAARVDSGQPAEMGDLVVEIEGVAASATAKPVADAPQAAASTPAPPASAESTPKPLDPRLGPGEWVDPQVREYLRNYMLRPDWNQSATTIKGRVIDAQGQPATNVEVVAQTNLFGTIAITRTDERGEFEVRSADSKPALIATSNDGALLGFFRASRDELAAPAESGVIKLEPPREINSRVVDGQQQPVAGAIVTAMFGEGLSTVATTDAGGQAKLRVPQAAPLEAVLARKDGFGLDVLSFDSEGKPERTVGASPFDFTLKGARTVTLHALDGRTGKAAPGVIASYQLKSSVNNTHGLHTLAELWKFVDDDGAASFAFAPADGKAWVNVRVYESKLFAKNLDFIDFDPQYRGNDYTIELWPKVKLTGQVRFPDGRPAAGMPVLVGDSEFSDPRRHLTATTDAAGKFELEVDSNDYYVIAAGDKQWATASKSLVVGHDPPPSVELTLGPSIRVFGRDPNLRRLVLAQQPATAYGALPRNALLPLRLTPHPIRSKLYRTAETDADGRYEFFVGPGTYIAEGPPGVNRAATPAFTLTDQKEYDIDRGLPGQANSRVKLRFVRADDPQVGLGRARYFIHRFDGQYPAGDRADANGVAEIESLGGRFVVEAMDAGEKLVAMVEGKPSETELVVPLGPPAVVRGRLIDGAGRRLRGRVDYHVVQGNDRIYAGSNPSVSQGRATVDDDGRFVLDQLAPGWTYSLLAYLDIPDAPRHGRSQSAWIGTAHAQASPVELGDIVLEWPEARGRVTAPAATQTAPAPVRQASQPKPIAAQPAGKLLLDQTVDPRVRAYLEQRWLTGEPDRKAATVRGKVVDAAGAPVADVDVTAEDATAYGTIAKTRSAANGEFEFEVRAYAQGNLPALLARDKDRKLIGVARPEKAEPVTIALAPAREVPIKVVDGQGQPVAGAAVTAFFANEFATSALTDAAGNATLAVLKDERLELSFASKDGLGFDYALYSPDGRLGDQPLPEPGAPPLVLTLDGARPVSVKVINGLTREPVAGALVSPHMIWRTDRRTMIMMHPDYAPEWKLTGDDGVAKFDAIAKTAGVTLIKADLRGELHSRRRDWWSYPDRGGNELVIELWPKVPLSGQVRFADGRPAAQLPVIVDGGSTPAVETLRTQTDDQGRFSLAVEPNDYYLVVAGDKKWGTPSRAIVVGHEPPLPIELTAQPAIRIFGSGSSVRELQLVQRPDVDYVELPREQLLPFRDTENQAPYPTIWRTTQVDAAGNFEFFVGPGKYELQGPDDVKLEYTPRFVLTDQKAQEVSLRRSDVRPRELKVRVERADNPGTLVPNATIAFARRGRQGDQPALERTEPTGEGTFYDNGTDRLLKAASPDQSLVGSADWSSGGGDLVIRVGPAGSIRGRIVDPSGAKVIGTISYTTDFNGTEERRGASMINRQFVKLDDQGRFTFDKLVPGVTYSLQAAITYPFLGGPPNNSIYQRGWRRSQWLGPVKPKSGEAVDLGDIVLEP